MQHITIKECYSCGAKHELVELREFKAPTGKHTHWFTCPTLEEPVGLTISSSDKGSVEIPPELAEHVHNAAASGRFLVAVFYVEEEDLEHDKLRIRNVHVMQEFPVNSVDGCIRHIDRELRRQHALPSDPSELPPAAERGPLVNLFADNPSG